MSEMQTDDAKMGIGQRTMSVQRGEKKGRGRKRRRGKQHLRAVANGQSESCGGHGQSAKWGIEVI